MRRYLLFQLIIVGICLGSAQAEVKLSASLERAQFLIFEPVKLRVTFENISGQPIELKGQKNRDYLQLIVRGREGHPVSRDQRKKLAPTVLPPNSTRTLVLNLTPLYNMRDPGKYSVQVGLSIPTQRPSLTNQLFFDIRRNKPLVMKENVVNGVTREYKLIRFSKNRRTTNLYLSVEAPETNQAFGAVDLGLSTFVLPPDFEFDQLGNVHILHTISTNLYRYTMASPAGRIRHQENYRVMAEQRPRITRLANGQLTITGGIRQSTQEREGLAEAQASENVPTAPSIPSDPNERRYNSPVESEYPVEDDGAPLPQYEADSQQMPSPEELARRRAEAMRHALENAEQPPNQ